MAAPDPRSSGALERAQSLLAQCAQATREARFEHLPDLVVRLEAELGALGTPAPRDAPGLRRLRAGLQNNRRLLDAALQGVEAARRRIVEVGETLRTLNTYDSLGRRATIRPSAQAFEKKA